MLLICTSNFMHATSIEIVVGETCSKYQNSIQVATQFNDCFNPKAHHTNIILCICIHWNMYFYTTQCLNFFCSNSLDLNSTGMINIITF